MKKLKTVYMVFKAFLYIIANQHTERSAHLITNLLVSVLHLLAVPNNMKMLLSTTYLMLNLFLIFLSRYKPVIHFLYHLNFIFLKSLVNLF